MCIIDTLSHFLVGYLQSVLNIRLTMSNCFYHKRKSTDLQASLASMHCSASTDRMIPVCWHSVASCELCLSLQQMRQLDDRLHKRCFFNSKRVAAGLTFRRRSVTTILSLQYTKHNTTRKPSLEVIPTTSATFS